MRTGDFVLKADVPAGAGHAKGPANMALEHKDLGKIIDPCEFYIADKDWVTIFPVEEGLWEVNQKDNSIICKTKEKSLFKVEIVYSLSKEGLKMGTYG